ncbi:FAD-binding oxidoreductase [Psychrobium sp. MM17-31]|uniref:flavin reductase family protein n=1 Tax=Psychrobium sp. MM17-31 TaxID=2917758 RepID=UPI001EF5A0AF|nr:FAD-binding oxidoreductase [Psychrobium sp. MM17-31]MCG7532850.1 FAD-binding oxidoreductase [Psychrobium sp. MM17-31]
MLSRTINKLSQWFLHHQSLAAYFEPVVQKWLPAWRSDTYRAQVIEVDHSRANCSLLTLSVPRTWPIHRAGQHIQLTIEANGRLLNRTFTVAISPNEAKKNRQITLLIKRHQFGQFTQPLEHVAVVGQWLSISKPTGEFVFESDELPVTMIAAGSGITPIIAMLSQHLASYSQPVHLRYIASHDQHFFVEQLSALAQEYAHFSLELCNRQQHEVTPLFVDEQPRDVYCCGPAELMKKVRSQANALGFSYFEEQFSVLPEISEQQQDFAVQYNRQKLTVSNQANLLSELERLQQSVIRGCGMGVCHQCQCVKKSGVVKDMRTGQLSGAGEQLIQLCVSQPMSDLELTQ